MTTALVVDDSPSRSRSFRRELIGTHVVVFDRAPEAIDWLRDHAPDIIFLDFDLHEYGLDIEDSGTGMDIVQYLCQSHDRLGGAAVVVHSLNADAGPAMVRLLHGCGYRACQHTHIWEQPQALAKAVDGTLFPPPKKTVS